jgi:uncharacterized protein YggE
MKKLSLLTGLVLVAAFVLSACAPITLPAQSSGSTTAAPRTIAVSGNGKVTLAPDVAYVYIGVQSQTDNVATALSENNAKAQTISNTIKELGIDAKDIQTTSFNIYPQQQFGPDGKPTTTTYMVNNTINVTVHDLSLLGKLLDSVVRAGANSINGINFDLLDKTKATSDARKLAVADAQSQAQELAAASGVTLGDLQSINAVVNTGPVPLYDAKVALAGSSTSQVPISAGQITITVDVNSVYAIK